MTHMRLSIGAVPRGTLRRLFWPAMVLCLPLQLWAQQPSTQESGDAPSRVARLSAVQGTVSLLPAGVSDWSLAPINYSITTGDRLFTAQDARAELEVGPFTVRLADSTDLTVTALGDHYAQFGLSQGTMRVSVYRLLAGDTIEVDTPNGAFVVRAPGTYRIEIPLNTDYTLVSVEEGSLDATGPGLAQAVATGQAVSFAGYNPIRALAAPRPPRTAFDQWSAERDQRVVASSCSRYMSDDIPGCADLDEYGRWVVTAEYGTVWYPSAVAVGWVPYRYGRWGWVDPWGWVWVEDEPWGFAPFHYGRWAMVGRAWAWIPGPIVARPYYSPGLVVFVMGPAFGGGVQAWFPLGPHEPFFPWYHYGPRYLRAVNATNVRGVTDIDVFVRVTNIQTVRWANRTHGFTAVPSAVFRNGERVDRGVVHVRPTDVERARIAAHPTVLPTRRAAAGGPPSPRPPAARPQPRTAVPRPIITKRAPPPENPPFAKREEAMKANPGRPLEPQQVKNLREGRPAGPQRDSAHPAQKPSAGRKAVRKPGRGGGGN